MLSAALAAFLSLCLFFAGGAQAWLATSYYQQSLDVRTRSGVYTTYTTTYTYQEEVKPTATSYEALSTQTVTNSIYDVTVVNVLLPTGVATAYDSSDDDSDYTSYYVDIFLTANPSYCTDAGQQWLWKTAQYVSVPYGVTPTAASVVTRETQYTPFGPTSTFTSAFLNPTDVPSAVLSSESSVLMYSMYWASRSCTVPSAYIAGLVSVGSKAVVATQTGAAASAVATGTGAAASASGTSYNTYYATRCAARLETYGADYFRTGYAIGHYEYCDTHYDCECYHGLLWWQLIVVIICSWVGLFFIIGLIESWFRFRNLARGRSARRGLPIAWTLIMIPWTCFFLCCLKRGYTKKSPEEQAALTAEWKAMGFGTKLGRWLKWGFRYKYPTFLGPAPFRRTKWEEKDIAQDVAQRRMSYTGAPGERNSVQGGAVGPVGAAATGVPAGTPMVGQEVSSYYAPQQPAATYAAPETVPRDFAQQQRGLKGNRLSNLHSVPEGHSGEGPLPALPPRTPPAQNTVSPVSSIDAAQQSIAGPAPKSPKGKGKEVVTEPAVGGGAPQIPEIAVAR